MSKSKYWKLREQENRQRLKTLEFINSYNKQIEQTYRRMLDSVQKEIDAFYGRYADKEGITIAEARKRVSQLDIEAYARKAKQYVQDKNFSDKANAEMKLYNLTMKVNRLELLKSNIGLELVNGFDDLEKLFGEKLTEEGIKEFRRQAGILGDTVTDTDSNKRYEKLADRLARASFHNATFSDRIWMHQDLLRNEIDKSLKQALISGRSMERLARDIRNAFGTSTKNAQRLMRTEIRRMQTDVAAESYKRNGNEKYEYMALGQHPCDICSSMNGKIYNVKDMEVGLNAPPMHPNCMCSTAPYVDEKAYQEWLDSFGASATDNKVAEFDPSNIQRSPAGQSLKDFMETNGIDYKLVEDLPSELSNEEIIEKLGGGDMTNGSCVSLACAYIANKAGWDVIDFRGGNSCKAFAMNGNNKKLMQLDGVQFWENEVFSSIKGAQDLMSQMENGKEYMLVTGKHASIVKNNNGDYEYLELQSSTENGWTDFAKYGTIIKTLRSRFGCSSSRSFMGMKMPQHSFLIDIESLYNSDEFRDILGYINTDPSAQKKGASGSVK